MQDQVLLRDLAKAYNVGPTTIASDCKTLGIEPLRVPRGPGDRGRPRHSVSARDARKIAARRREVSGQARTEFELSHRKLKQIVAAWFKVTHGRKATRVQFYFDGLDQCAGLVTAARVKP